MGSIKLRQMSQKEVSCSNNTYSNILFTILHIYRKQSNNINHHGFREYWFTIVLFLFLAIYYTISLISYLTHNIIQDIGLILISIIGIMVLAINRGDGIIWEILCLENFCKYFQFFTLGLLLKKYNTRFLQIINNHIFRGG